MSNLTASTIELLQYLLPGFLCAWIFYGFTSFRRPQQFEQVIQALIFTLIIRVIMFGLKAFEFAIFSELSQWLGAPEIFELVLSTSLAFFLGFIFAFLSNNDLFHAIIRFLRITTETSYPTEWYGAFAKQKHYVVLHLPGERRLYGWPSQWPSSSGDGHFEIEQASWLVESSDAADETQVDDQSTGVSSVLVKSSDVEMIEFIKPLPK